MRYPQFAMLVLALAAAGAAFAQPMPGAPDGGDSQGQFRRPQPPMRPDGAQPGQSGDPFQGGGRTPQGFRSPRGEGAQQPGEGMPRAGMPQGEGMPPAGMPPGGGMKMPGFGPGPEAMQPGRGFMPRNPFGDGLFMPEQVMQNQRALGLTDAQTSFIRSELRASVMRFMDLQWQQSADEEALSALLKEASVDETKVEAALEKLMGVENTIKRERMRLLVRVRNILNAEQRTKMQQLSAPQSAPRSEMPQPPAGMQPEGGGMMRQPGPPRDGEQQRLPGQPGPIDPAGRPISSAVTGQPGE